MPQYTHVLSSTIGALWGSEVHLLHLLFSILYHNRKLMLG